MVRYLPVIDSAGKKLLVSVEQQSDLHAEAHCEDDGDKLEEENPGCFDDPAKTFADLYMKSGLYITEIVKRLYRSEGMKAAFPDEKERIRHILQKQVYGMAPTRIIFLIATNYILGFDEELKKADHHFAEADAAEAAKNGTLKELVEKCFG